MKILSINPGSTSTKIALFDGSETLFAETLRHTPGELAAFGDIQGQLDFRAETVENAVTARGYALSGIDAFSGRGGGLLPCEGGTYEVTEFLAEHASRGMSGQHPAQLASQICKRFADRYGKRAFVVNSPNTDEFEDVSRVAGLRGIYRESHIHALNQKEAALRFCAERGLWYENANLIVCHLGGGISVTAHKRGRMVDSNDIIGGSGPMTPTRAGDLPYSAVIELAYSGEYTKKQLMDRLNVYGGMTDVFGTSDMQEIKRRVESGDKTAALYCAGMAYHIAKYAGAMAVALRGGVDAIILTGGLANWAAFTSDIAGMVDWIAEVAVIPGEFELEALAAGALRVMRGEEEPKVYTGEPVWRGM